MRLIENSQSLRKNLVLNASEVLILKIKGVEDSLCNFLRASAKKRIELMGLIEAA